ncbi:IclR family transcriptional regulator [Herbaspirillum sp. LeCh32-8]|uniref:IclR family transcriptional regulator n=1 Tax=Herbaspirillum sp. LeCh32-8 TaxID=2821356 RepID=UPI001AEA946F|nr:IclR family transcriptional regulator [Herbaspirillum sp. LeCh32-8]MBP0600662.1 IclR family transcriptional regulator [Herbaspirillum sp. LeCh32-8]
MEGIQVISRAAALLREVSANPDGLSLGQLATATGLARSTVQRIVNALESEHLVQAGAGGVRPGWGLRRLAELPGPNIARELRAEMYGLFEATHETIDLSTLVNGEVLFMDRFLSDQPVRAVPALGADYPAYSMANGKALLSLCTDAEIHALYGDRELRRLTPNTLGSAELLQKQIDAIRRGGVACDLEEHAMGTCAVGLPVGHFRGMKLAISVVLPVARFAAKRAATEKAVAECARRCQQRLQELAG